MPLAFFKDRFLPEEECFVSIHDRSFRFGDGLFETLLVYNGQLYDVAHHLERLRNGLSAFRIALDIAPVEGICRELIAKNTISEGYVRIVVSRGENAADAVGYLPKGAKPYLLVQTVRKPYPGARSLTLFVSSQRAAMHTPSKTNNALIYTLAMLEAEEQACDNALLLDEAGHVCETASGNIFWVRDGVLYTPSPDLPLVPGTMRKRVLEIWDARACAGRFTLAALQQADEVFMTNSACIAAPVVALKPMGASWPAGPHTSRIRTMLDAQIDAACSTKHWKIQDIFSRW